MQHNVGPTCNAMCKPTQCETNIQQPGTQAPQCETNVHDNAMQHKMRANLHDNAMQHNATQATQCDTNMQNMPHNVRPTCNFPLCHATQCETNLHDNAMPVRTDPRFPDPAHCETNMHDNAMTIDGQTSSSEWREAAFGPAVLGST